MRGSLSFYLFISWAALGIGGVIGAQEPHRMLEPVIVVEERPFRDWRWRRDSTWGWISVGSHLMDLLSQQSGLYLRDYGGQGALKTVSLRGLSPTLTVLTFQDFPIRQPQLGLVNIAPYYLGGLSEVSFRMGGDLRHHPGGAGGIDLLLRPQRKHHYLEGRIGSYGEAALEALVERPAFLWHLRSLSALNQYPYDEPGRGRMTSAQYEILQSGAVYQRGRWESTLWGFRSVQMVPGPVGPYGPRLPPEFLQEWQILPTLWYRGQWAVGLQAHWSHLFYRDYLGVANPTRQISFQAQLARTWQFGRHHLDVQGYGAQDHLYSERIGIGFSPIRQIVQREGAFWSRLNGPLKSLRYRIEGRLNALARFRPLWSVLINVEWRKWGVEVLRGGRYPSLYERYWIGYGRPDLRPERFWQVQLYGGWQQGPWEVRLTSTAAWVQDRILAIPLSPVRWQAYNLGYVRSLSLEASIGYTGPTRQAKLSMSYTQAQDFSVTRGRPLPYVPPWIGSLFFSQRVGHFLLLYQAEVVSQRPISLAPGPLNELTPYLLHSLSLRWWVQDGFVVLSLSRWAWRTYQVIMSYPMPVRLVSLEWRWNF